MLGLARVGVILCVAFMLIGAVHAREVITLVKGGASQQIEAELAITGEERARGLMGRTDFAAGDAMLFVFPQAGKRSFWMKDTPISLDIIFFDDAGRWLNTATATQPYSLENIYSSGEARYVLELAAGEAVRLGIGEGTRLIRP